MIKIENIIDDLYMYELELEDQHPSHLAFHQVYRVTFEKIWDSIAEFEDPGETADFISELAVLYLDELKNFINKKPTSRAWRPYYKATFKSSALQLLSGANRHLLNDYSYLLSKYPYINESDLDKINEIQLSLRSQVVSMLSSTSYLVRLKPVQSFGYHQINRMKRKAAKQSGAVVVSYSQLK